jgi:hypothetical protein
MGGSDVGHFFHGFLDSFLSISDLGCVDSLLAIVDLVTAGCPRSELTPHHLDCLLKVVPKTPASLDSLERLVGLPLIQSPGFLELVESVLDHRCLLAFFGWTKYVESVLDHLQRMADSSMFNRCALHRGHIDVVLLKRSMGNYQFDYSGIRFDSISRIYL